MSFYVRFVTSRSDDSRVPMVNGYRGPAAVRVPGGVGGLLRARREVGALGADRLHSGISARPAPEVCWVGDDPSPVPGRLCGELTAQYVQAPVLEEFAAESGAFAIADVAEVVVPIHSLNPFVSVALNRSPNTGLYEWVVSVGVLDIVEAWRRAGYPTLWRPGAP